MAVSTKLFAVLIALAMMLAMSDALRYRLLLTNNGDGTGAMSDNNDGTATQQWGSGPLNSRFSRPRRLMQLLEDAFNGDDDDDNLNY